MVQICLQAENPNRQSRCTLWRGGVTRPTKAALRHNFKAPEQETCRPLPLERGTAGQYVMLNSAEVYGAIDVPLLCMPNSLF